MIVLKRTMALAWVIVSALAAYSTQNPWVGLAALAVGVIAAIFVGRKWGF